MRRHTLAVKEKKSTVVTLADIKANVEAKAPGEMHGDLQKWALVSNGLHAEKSAGRDFFRDAQRYDGQSTGLQTKDPIPCTGGALVNALV